METKENAMKQMLIAGLQKALEEAKAEEDAKREEIKIWFVEQLDILIQKRFCLEHNAHFPVERIAKRIERLNCP